MAKTCALCGKPSGMYFFCVSCNKLKADRKIEKCEECGTWHYVDKPCKCEKPLPKEEPIVETKETPTNELTCLLCGEDSSGKHFCKKCYAKYKDRKIEVQIRNCIEVIITDEYGNKETLCDDGTRVRSRAEALISNFFFNNKIRTIYEREFSYMENGKEMTIHPDFFLPDYGEIQNGKPKGIIVEYNELTNPNYLKTKEYTRKIYEDHGYEVITLSKEDIDNNLRTLRIKFGIM